LARAITRIAPTHSLNLCDAIQSLQFPQSLIEIGDDVVDMLQTYGKSDEVGRNP
jgi:hypothetical protein